jgi:multiple sugar transport system substrate-binding protein
MTSDIKTSRRGFLKTVGGFAGATALTPLMGSLSAFAQDEQVLRFFADGTDVNKRPLFDSFVGRNPGTQITFEGVPFPDYQNLIVQRFRGGNPGFDIFQVDPTYIPIFSQRNFLYDLTDALAGKAQGVLFPSDIAGATYKGRMLTMPIWESTQLLYYNKSLLDAAGVPLPSSDPAERMTWADTVKAAAAAQAGGADWGLAFEQVDRYYQLQILPESLGGGPGVTGPDLLTVDVANDAWIEAGAWYGRLFESGVSPRAIENAEETRTLFREGKLAFFVAGPWNITGFSAIEGLDFGIAAHPYFEGGTPVTPSESWHFGIAPTTTNPELALKFLEYAALDTEGSLKTVEISGGLPSNIEAASIVLARIPENNPALAGVDDLIRNELANTAIRRPRTLGYLQLEELATRAWSDIRKGADAAETLQRTQQELARTFERIER